MPELSASTQAVIRAAYGVLMLATLVQALPEARRFFLSERWGGYAKSSRAVDALQNPVVMPLLVAIWVAAAVALTVGWVTPWSALVNLLLCRYFFLHMRWRGVLRGMGAPGFLSYWLALAVFLLSTTSRYAPGLRQLALLVVQVDMAGIMISAGVYKFTAGYRHNQGMELGLCNPMWGYWRRWYAGWRPGNPVFWTMNQMAWLTEVTGGLLMLMPRTRELGGLLIAASFVFILTQIRLGFLCEMVIVSTLLFVTPGGLVDQWLAIVPAVVSAPPSVAAGGTLALAAADVLGAGLWTYLILLPLAHAALSWNFYGRRTLPGPLQRALVGYTNFFGIMIWRVFTVDLINFFLEISSEPRTGGARTRRARLGAWPRFNHVGEMICLASLFTTLKYYPSNNAIFVERLLRYARTVPCGDDELVVFEYVRIVKRASHFEFVPAGEYRVDLEAGTIEERLFDATFSTRAAHAVSPVHEGATPGSYAPAPVPRGRS